MIKSYSVSEVNRFIKQIFSYEQIFYNISVMGEVSNLKFHVSGNIFFTLKDEGSSIRCVMFKMYADKISFFLKNGMFVYVKGDLNVYEKNGIYQIYVTIVQQQGEGLIQKKSDFLHEKLLKEGLFDVENKINLVKMPKVVGVVTSIDGAALQDVIQILSKRLPILKLKVFSCLVQGQDAVKSILSALSKVASDDEVENLIICRGGGSKEDLNPFDDETVCRTVFKLKKPTISAIGHETDHCLLDLVSDLRAPTPSAAAQLVCVHKYDLLEKMNEKQCLMKIHFKNFISCLALNLNYFKNMLLSMSPMNVITNLNVKINEFLKRLYNLILKEFIFFESRIDKFCILLENLSPFKILSMGYCLVLNESFMINSVNDVKKNQCLSLILNDGNLKVQVLNKQFKKL